MSYAGAEEGQEAFLARILEFRSSRPELARCGCEYLPDCCDAEWCSPPSAGTATNGVLSP